MDVWRRISTGRGGIIIQEMLKCINIIVDRVFEDVGKTGYPRRAVAMICL